MAVIQLIRAGNNTYLIQSRLPLPANIISNIIELLVNDNSPSGNGDIVDTRGGFFAPFQNYQSTFSTTIIEIIRKFPHFKIANKELDVIRIEPVYSAPQDPLIYKYYSSIEHYKMELSHTQDICVLNDINYFKPLALDYNLSSTISKILLAITQEDMEKLTYFDVMSWIQCNSEHSRHWVFRTPLDTENTTLMSIIKSTLYGNSNPSVAANSLIAFSDNSSAIRGNENRLFTANYDTRIYSPNSIVCHPCLTAETHNYPTYYHPFQGAATGVGGRIRDSLATGCGSISSASLTGYSVNSLDLLQTASDGASDYANKIGEPCIGGFLRWHNNFEKPIMFSAGVGYITDSHLYNPATHAPLPNDYIVKIGPPAFKIGFGGSIQSSIVNTTSSNDMTAIQRGDPYNGNKVARFLEILATMRQPIIKKIHDQGAGGLGNVITELLDGWDAVIDLQGLPYSGCMDSLECWLSEYQEQMVFICTPENYKILEGLATKEGVLIHRLGLIQSQKNGKITLTKKNGTRCDSFVYNYYYRKMDNMEHLNQYSIPLKIIATTNSICEKYGGNPKKTFSIFEKYHQHHTDQIFCHESELERSFKFHLTNKIDRSVGGCVVQQSCIGPFGIPISNYAITRISPLSSGGILTAIGENIFVGQSVAKWINKTVAELLANLAGVPNQPLHLIKLSGNWMTNSRSDQCLDILYQGVQHLTMVLKSLALAIDGGKDSLSMVMRTPSGEIISPPTLVLTSYSNVDEYSITKRITPLLKPVVGSKLWVIDILSLFDTINFIGVKQLWDTIQQLFDSGIILALHDGGSVIDILEEMAVVSNIGLDVDESILKVFRGVERCVFQEHFIIIQTIPDYTNEDYFQIAIINMDKLQVCDMPLAEIFHQRMVLSTDLDKSTISYEVDLYVPSSYIYPLNPLDLHISTFTRTVKVAIIRDEGSNSHKEMAAAFSQFANVICIDYTMNQLLTLSNTITKEFESCDGFVFVGGFAYGDVLGSGVASSIIMEHTMGSYYHNHSFSIFGSIFSNPNKFVLGVCNGCQMLIKYGLFGNKVDITYNSSGKFESRWLAVNYKTPITMSNTTLGIWVAHGEGRFVFQDGWNDDGIRIIGTYLNGKYPTNPNGSMYNAIGISNSAGNHVAIMPHPERSLFKWQCEYIPDDIASSYDGPYTPWIELFADLINKIKI